MTVSEVVSLSIVKAARFPNSIFGNRCLNHQKRGTKNKRVYLHWQRYTVRHKQMSRQQDDHRLECTLID